MEPRFVVGKALNREFGISRSRRYHCCRDAGTGTAVQVMTDSNKGTAGTQGFLFATEDAGELAAATADADTWNGSR